MLENVGHNVEDAEPFSQTDEKENELVLSVHILDILLKIAGDVEESDEGSESSVHQTGEHCHVDRPGHHQTFLKNQCSLNHCLRLTLRFLFQSFHCEVYNHRIRIYNNAVEINYFPEKVRL